MRNTVIATFCLLFLSACQPDGRIYEKHRELSPDLEWLKDDVKTFEVSIEEAGKYNMSLGFRYANGYQYRTARVQVTEISPSGKESSNNYELKIREDNGDYIGDPGFDIWDSEHLVATDKSFDETGTYTFKIAHNMPNDPLHFAMEIGLIIDSNASE